MMIHSGQLKSGPWLLEASKVAAAPADEELRRKRAAARRIKKDGTDAKWMDDNGFTRRRLNRNTAQSWESLTPRQRYESQFWYPVRKAYDEEVARRTGTHPDKVNGYSSAFSPLRDFHSNLGDVDHFIAHHPHDPAAVESRTYGVSSKANLARSRRLFDQPDDAAAIRAALSSDPKNLNGARKIQNYFDTAHDPQEGGAYNYAKQPVVIDSIMPRGVMWPISDDEDKHWKGKGTGQGIDTPVVRRYANKQTGQYENVLAAPNARDIGMMGVGSAGGYDRMGDAIRTTAKRYGVPYSHAVQAGIWNGVGGTGNPETAKTGPIDNLHGKDLYDRIYMDHVYPGWESRPAGQQVQVPAGYETPYWPGSKQHQQYLQTNPAAAEQPQQRVGCLLDSAGDELDEDGFGLHSGLSEIGIAILSEMLEPDSSLDHLILNTSSPGPDTDVSPQLAEHEEQRMGPHPRHGWHRRQAGAWYVAADGGLSAQSAPRRPSQVAPSVVAVPEPVQHKKTPRQQVPKVPKAPELTPAEPQQVTGSWYRHADDPQAAPVTGGTTTPVNTPAPDVAGQVNETLPPPITARLAWYVTADDDEQKNPALNNGVGSNAGDNTTPTISNDVKDITDGMTDPHAPPLPAPKLPPLGQWPAGVKPPNNGAWASDGGAAHPSVTSTPSTFSPPGDSVNRWRPQVEEGLKRNGLPTSLAPQVLHQIQTESSGNPNAINNYDSNAKAGHPSQGLLQTIPSTFNQYHLPGDSTNINDPQANIDSAIGYAKHTYGPGLMNSHGMGMGSGRGYDQGGWLPPGHTHVVNNTGEPELVIPMSILRNMKFGAFGDFGDDGYDYEGMTNAEYRHRMRHIRDFEDEHDFDDEPPIHSGELKSGEHLLEASRHIRVR